MAKKLVSHKIEVIINYWQNWVAIKFNEKNYRYRNDGQQGKLKLVYWILWFKLRFYSETYSQLVSLLSFYKVYSNSNFTVCMYVLYSVQHSTNRVIAEGIHCDCIQIELIIEW